MKLRRIFAVCALVIVCFVTLATPALAYGGYYDFVNGEYSSYVMPYSYELDCRVDCFSDTIGYGVCNQSVIVDSSYGVFPDLNSASDGTPPNSYEFSRDGYDFYVSPEILNVHASGIYDPVITFSNFYADLSIEDTYDRGLANFPLLYLTCLSYVNPEDFLLYHTPYLIGTIEYYCFNYNTGKIEKVVESFSQAPISQWAGEIICYDLNSSFDVFSTWEYQSSVVYVESLTFCFEDNSMTTGEFVFNMDLDHTLSDDIENYAYNQTVEDFCPELDVTIEETIIVEEIIEEVVTFDSFDFTEWLYTSVSSVLSLEIIPGVPLSMIVGSVLGISLLFAFLKFFS